MAELYYSEPGIELWHGDARDWLPTLAAGSVAAVVTDPPYGSGKYEHDVRPPADLLARLVGDFSTCAIFGYPEPLIGWCIELGRQPDEWVTWWTTNKQGGIGTGTLLCRESECIAIFGSVPGGRRVMRPRATHKFGQRRAVERGLDPLLAREGDVWAEASTGMCFNAHLRQHPNEKPISIMEKLVLLCSDEGDVIADPYAGSGSTLVAAKRLGRRALGCEIDEAHCATAARRLQSTTPPLPFDPAPPLVRQLALEVGA